jgi:hypothetical protein
MAPFVRNRLFALSSSLVFIFGLAPMAPSMGSDLAAAPDAQELRFGTGNWDAAALGNHRAVVRVTNPAEAVRVRIPWRRRDTNPERKNVVVMDASTGIRIRNVCPVAVGRELGDFVFQPATAPGDYYFYYLTNVATGSAHYPQVTYPEMESTADDAWLKRWGLAPLGGLVPTAELPEAQVAEIQAIDEFDSFFPMEVIATAGETAGLISRYPDAPYLLFPEDRRFPARLTDDLPLRWVQAGPKNEFRGEALRGEFYAFQIGVFACRSAIENVEVTFGDLVRTRSALVAASSGSLGKPNRDARAAGAKNRSKPTPVVASSMSGPPPVTASVIPASGMHSFNTGGINWDGRPFTKVCAVPLGKVQPLWCGVQVPKDIPPGRYEGEVTLSPKGLPATVLKITLDVKPGVLEDAGDSDPSRMSRLRWLDSRIAFDDDIVPPYTPLRVSGRTVSCLGRSVAIADGGFPDRIQSFFTPELTGIGGSGRDLLSSPIALIAEDADRNTIPWTPEKLEFIKQTPGVVVWRAESQSGSFTLSVLGTMEFDGFVEFKVSLAASADLDVSDIRLDVPLLRDAARYMMGLGYKGGLRPAEFAWTWDRKKNQDALWLGDVNAGLQISLRDENYSRPLNTNFYLSKPLELPPSWWNQGEGVCAVQETSASTVLFAASGGSRRVRAGEVLHFNFNLLLTPFKPIDPKAHFASRYFHAFKPVEEVAGAGANTINVHHAMAINPYINYPFLRPAEMKRYIDEAHARGMKVKIYYTIRELSNRAAELFALRSLGNEVFSPGPGGGFSWLQEHLVSSYIPAWFVPELKDAAVINSGMSRWHNYYLEGLDWLVRNVGIDGLYIDDVAFDRTTMKRVRKILDRGRPGSLIDLHSANQYNPRDGFASSANLYLEHFPYLDRLWFGEYFDYNSAPDYWLVEISGIPFGLMGEMLQDGGNPWRGLVYGMTNRLPWSGQDPARLWKVWDEFGIGESEMFGCWSPNCPVRTDNQSVLGTAYVKKGGALVALASWAKDRVQVRLEIDWRALGLDETSARLAAPAIADFQPEAVFRPGDPIPVEPGRGWLLLVR